MYKFRQTGKISDYLKYREEISKEERLEVKDSEDDKDKRNSNQEHRLQGNI